MECLSPTVMNNYVTCFRMLTHLGVNNIWATGVLRNNRLRKCTIIGDKQPQKRNVDTLDRAHQAKKNSATLTVVGLNDNREVYIASSKFSEPKRFVRCMNKVERKYIEKQQLNQFHCYNKNRVFFEKMDQSVSKYKIGIRMKKWWWSPFAYMFDVSMLDVVLQNAWVLYHIDKDEFNESLPLLTCSFLEIFKGRQISLEPWRNSECPIKCLLWGGTLSGAI